MVHCQILWLTLQAPGERETLSNFLFADILDYDEQMGGVGGQQFKRGEMKLTRSDPSVMEDMVCTLHTTTTHTASQMRVRTRSIFG